MKVRVGFGFDVHKLDGRTRYYVDGACLIDYLDSRPLDSGWFGFRTTLSTTRIANFRCY